MLPSEYVQKGWTIEVSARDKYSEFVATDSPDACMWCILGAIRVSESDGTITMVQKNIIYNYLIQHINGGVASWNDRQETSEPVIKMLQEAELEVLGIG